MNKLPTEVKFKMEELVDKKALIKLIEAAADWMDENPSLQPAFSSICGNTVNTDDETASMTKDVHRVAGISMGSSCLFGGLQFSLYAHAVLGIKKLGFNNYVSENINRYIAGGKS